MSGPEGAASAQVSGSLLETKFSWVNEMMTQMCGAAVGNENLNYRVY
jgi:hypothetical protein